MNNNRKVVINNEKEKETLPICAFLSHNVNLSTKFCFERMITFTSREREREMHGKMQEGK